MIQKRILITALTAAAALTPLSVHCACASKTDAGGQTVTEPVRSFAPDSDPTAPNGDWNGNGKLNADDLALLLQATAKLIRFE